MSSAKDNERPPNSDFQQQNLKAWHPLLTPGWVIGVFLFIGVVFIPVGFVVLQASNSVVELSQRYDNVIPLGSTGPIEIRITEDMAKPVFFYYQLTNFYQNHRRYVKSRNDLQLRGGNPTNLDSCDPLAKYNGGGTGKERIMYPCGLIANSYFNDAFAATNSEKALAWTDEGIAWPSDKEHKFRDGGYYNNESYIDYGPSGVKLNHTHEDFIVWMRTAGLPTFKKLRYIIREDLKKGDVVSVDITNNYNVAPFDGTKSVVLSTTSWLGGKNEFLGNAYIIVGALCIFLALVFSVKHHVSPRKLGDMQYFNWGQVPAS